MHVKNTAIIGLFLPFAYAQATQSEWGQCGGIGFVGPTVCPSTWTCVIHNDYFRQCLIVPTDAPSTTATTTVSYSFLPVTICTDLSTLCITTALTCGHSSTDTVCQTFCSTEGPQPFWPPLSCPSTTTRTTKTTTTKRLTTPKSTTAKTTKTTTTPKTTTTSKTTTTPKYTKTYY